MVEEEGIVGSVTDDRPWFKPVTNPTVPEGTGPDIVVTANKNQGFNLNSFITDIRTRGVLKSSSFLVNIVPPKILTSKWPDTKNILIRCDSAALPSANFQMHEIYRHGYGPQESSPHNIQFEPVNMTFLMDSQGEIYNFWYSWMNGIMNYNRQNGLNKADLVGKKPYEMAYKDDYSTTIKVLVYNESADTVMQCSLQKAFPMGMSEINLNWMNSDEPIRMNIPISYRDYYTEVAAKRSTQLINNFLAPTIDSSSIQSAARKTNILGGFNLDSALDRLLSDIILK